MVGKEMEKEQCPGVLSVAVLKHHNQATILFTEPGQAPQLYRVSKNQDKQNKPQNPPQPKATWGGGRVHNLLESIEEGNQAQVGTWRQELKQTKEEEYLLVLSLACSATFLKPRFTCPGVVPPLIDWALLHQLSLYLAL